MLRGLRSRIKKLGQPVPMRDFADYDHYWDDRGQLGQVLTRWEVAAEVIEDGASVLDVGCGSGEFLIHLRKTRPNVKAVGADFSSKSVEMVRENGFEAFVLDIAEEDIEGQYDYVTCLEVLEHIPNAEDALVRLKAAARKRLVVSTPNVGYIDNRIRLALYGRFPITNCIFHIKEHVRHWTERDFREWAGRFGLLVTDVRGQYGRGRFLPVEKYPGLLSPGLVYVLERNETAGDDADAAGLSDRAQTDAPQNSGRARPTRP